MQQAATPAASRFLGYLNLQQLPKPCKADNDGLYGQQKRHKKCNINGYTVQSSERRMVVISSIQ